MASVIPVDVTAMPAQLRTTSAIEPKLPIRAAVVPEGEQLSGPYGPRFVGYGLMPPLSLRLRIAPFLFGAKLGLSAAAAAALVLVATGKL